MPLSSHITMACLLACVSIEWWTASCSVLFQVVARLKSDWIKSLTVESNLSPTAQCTVRSLRHAPLKLFSFSMDITVKLVYPHRDRGVSCSFCLHRRLAIPSMRRNCVSIVPSHQLMQNYDYSISFFVSVNSVTQYESRWPWFYFLITNKSCYAILLTARVILLTVFEAQHGHVIHEVE